MTPQAGGKLLVRGTCSDNGEVKRVLVNGQPAKPESANYAEWSIVLDATAERIIVQSEDAAGNQERLPHEWAVELR